MKEKITSGREGFLKQDTKRISHKGKDVWYHQN